jgi:hypothetical protein
MEHVEKIHSDLSRQVSYEEIIKKVYLTYPTKSFIGYEEEQFEILNKVSLQFSIPITCIHAAGSAKVGRSFHKNKDFEPGVSDLDLAIINPELYNRYMEIVFEQTKGYSNLTQFPRRDGRAVNTEYVRYLSKGIFRPDLMPYSPERADWLNFFSSLSKNYTHLFNSINACIYMSQGFFYCKTT